MVLITLQKDIRIVLHVMEPQPEYRPAILTLVLSPYRCPITAYDYQSSRNGLVIKPFNPAFHYQFGMVYKHNWSNNRLIGLLKAVLPDHLRE
ncbi:MAG: hypothetical protein WED11_04705 [Natronospirillum sp.]